MSAGKQYLVSRIVLLTIGALLGMAGVVLFLLPNQIAPSGISGIGVILNEIIGVPVGLVIIIGNIPIQILAYRELFGWRAVLPTAYAVLIYSVGIDVISTYIGVSGVSDDLLLNAIFGGMLTGFGGGIIYRAGGSYGGTSTLARILRKRYGLSLSTSSLFTDVFVLMGAGIVFGWEAALYALVVLFISRSVSDYVLDGGEQTYTALVLSDKPAPMSRAINEMLHHRITTWGVDNPSNGKQYDMLMVSIARSEVHGFRQLVEHIDGDAFVTILQAHSSYGEEFQKIASHLPFRFDEVEDSVTMRMEPDEIDEAISS